VSCWSTCEHNVLFRLFELFKGNETARNLRLVNRHWCKVISQSLDEISPSPFRFHVMDMRLLKLHFSGIRKLVLLDLDLLCDLWFERIGLLQKLEVLSVRFSVPKKEAKVTNEGLNSIIEMKSLMHLELSGCQFLTPSGIRVLSKKQNLRFLDLSRSRISNRFMLPITTMKNLNHLNLSENPGISGIGIQVLITFENLKSLCLKNCSNLNEQDLTEIAKFTKLRTLDLRMCEYITGSAFQFFSSISKLKTLDLSDCASLSDSSLSYIAKIRHLKTLVLQYCPCITDKGLAFLNEHDSLNCLRIGGSDFITDEGLRTFSQNSSLESISLLFLNNISTLGIQFIISIVNLHYLSIIECRNVGNIKDSGLLLKHRSRAFKLDQYPTHFEWIRQ